MKLLALPGKWWLFVAASAVGIGAGFGIGFGVRESRVSDLEGSLDSRSAEVASAQASFADQKSKLDSLQAQVTKLTEDGKKLQQQLDARNSDAAVLETARRQLPALQSQVETLKRQLDEAGGGQQRFQKVQEIAEGLENDRVLLMERRKDTPDTRAEAQRYWTNVRGLAARSNPALVARVDKVTTSLPAYFTWRERNFTSTQESALSYALTGARNYDQSIDEFWSAVLLVVIQRIDALNTLTTSD